MGLPVSFDVFVAKLFCFYFTSKVPGFIQAFMPKGTLEFHEESWNAYPYFKTIYTVEY